MIENFESVKKQLSQLAEVINLFKSEAVQLRIIELVLGQSEDTIEPNGEVKKVRRKSAARRRKSASTPKHDVEDGSGSARKNKAAGSKGAQATLTQLLAGTFFDKPKTIGEIVEHCKHNLALSLKASDFSGKLARAIRDGKLTRKKNSDNQYEYKKP